MEIPQTKQEAVNVFEKKMEYGGNRYQKKPEYYIQETWVEIHKRMPKKTVKYYC